MTTDPYLDFLASKRIAAPPAGFAVNEALLPPALFPFQRFVAGWACQRGRAALFEDCGLGKTLQQLAWAQQVCRHTGGDVLILAPLAVAAQTVAEGERFGIPVTHARTQAEARPGITITNYERLGGFDPERFAGVVLDESSILKSFMGQTKRRILEAFARTPFKLACTATPAPNDFVELGNHAEFLGVMPANQMLMRWFINDTMNFGTWRLKHHAAADFWRWVATWAVCISRPSDLGFSDDGFVLPEHHLSEISVEVDLLQDAGDNLFRVVEMSATKIHEEMRRTCGARAKACADLVNGSPEPWAVWCNTNYEADELVRLIPDAVEVRGAESPEAKERKLLAFTRGEARVIITKPSIAGFGLNWQHCAREAFVGLSYSFEELYQASKRLHRFGQKRPVRSYLITASTESGVLAAVRAKAERHEEMRLAMAGAARSIHTGRDLTMRVGSGSRAMTLPPWLGDQCA